MRSLASAVDARALETSFSGVVRVDRAGAVELARAYGQADRGYGLPNEPETRFALASVTKGLTALAVVGLVEDGALELGTTARSILGDDLPLVAADVTIEQLLAHRSGIGDYLDEELEVDLEDYPMPVPVHELASTEDYLTVLDGHPQKFAPGERFAYCNSGYVVLALLAERVSGTAFHQLVQRRVCEPAGLHDTAFPRSDELGGRTARGYVAAGGPWRTNVFHLPVRGSGDGGAYSTAADLAALWAAFFAGRIVGERWIAEMTRPRSATGSAARRYGLGFWLHPTSRDVLLVGMDAGVSCSSTHDPRAGITRTVLSNTADGAWPIADLLDEPLPGDGRG